MAIEDFFPARPSAAPPIYALASTHPDHAGLRKVGYTARVAAVLGEMARQECVFA